jgi:superfamily II DNA or RNA helicase
MSPPSFDLAVPLRTAAQGHSPGLQPRQWQRQLIQLLRARLVQAGPQGQDVLLHAGPGAGKTLAALLAFAQLRREGRLERFLVFCHRSSIGRQWQAAADRLDLELVDWDPRQGATAAPGLLLSYQSAARHRTRLEQELAITLEGEPWLAIADEVHHLGIDPEEPEASSWAHAFTQLSASARLRLGLSGTPFRADSLGFCAARRLRVLDHGVPCERIVPDLCVEPRRLIAAGDVRPLEFRFQDGTVEHGHRWGGPADRDETSPLSAEPRETWRARNLRRAIHLGDGGGIALQLLHRARRKLESVRRGHPGAGGLVVARDIAHARSITHLLQEQGDRVLLVHSQDSAAAGQLAEFRRGEADWLVSIDMCAEGFDAPRIRVVAYLTTVVTRSRFVQAITRAVRMDGDQGRNEPVPRHPSYVYAPADPLLMQYARSWSISEPYWLRSPGRGASVGSTPCWGPPDPRGPLEALADAAGSMIRIRGPELPAFLGRSP